MTTATERKLETAASSSESDRIVIKLRENMSEDELAKLTIAAVLALNERAFQRSSKDRVDELGLLFNKNENLVWIQGDLKNGPFGQIREDLFNGYMLAADEFQVLEWIHPDGSRGKAPLNLPIRKIERG